MVGTAQTTDTHQCHFVVRCLPPLQRTGIPRTLSSSCGTPCDTLPCRHAVLLAMRKLRCTQPSITRSRAVSENMTLAAWALALGGLLGASPLREAWSKVKGNDNLRSDWRLRDNQHLDIIYNLTSLGICLHSNTISYNCNKYLRYLSQESKGVNMAHLK